MNVFGFEATVMSLVFLVLTGVKVFAFIDAATRRADAFTATNKLTKPAWLLILGLALACDLVLSGVLMLRIVGIVASFVYVLDVRPALASVTRRR